jgi:hypothetical protein
MRKKIRYHFQFEKYFVTYTDGFGAGSCPEVSEKPDPETVVPTYICGKRFTKEYEILRSPGSGASLLKTGQVYHYCAMRGICLLNRAISPTFLPLCPGHSTFHQMYFPPSSPQDTVDSTRCIFLMGV